MGFTLNLKPTPCSLFWSRLKYDSDQRGLKKLERNTVIVNNIMKGLTWFEVRQRVHARPGILGWSADDLKKYRTERRK